MSEEFPYELMLIVPATVVGLGALRIIEEEWSGNGEWIGHGRGLGKEPEADVQVAFRNKDQAVAAKSRALAILRRYKVNGRFQCNENHECREHHEHHGKEKGERHGKVFRTGEPDLTKEIRELL